MAVPSLRIWAAAVATATSLFTVAAHGAAPTDQGSGMLSGRLGAVLDVGALSPTDVWAVGLRGPSSQSNTASWHWDGHRWTRVRVPHPGERSRLEAITAVSSTDIWAAGWTNLPQTVPLMVHWDGTSWSEVQTPSVLGTFTALTSTSNDDVWAVGDRNDDDTGVIEHYDGTQWTLADEQPPGYLSGISARSTSDVWAVGDKQLFRRPFTWHWDGTSWSVVPPSLPDSRLIDALDVDVLPSGRAHFVGNYGGEGGGGMPAQPLERRQRTLAESWDGSAWTQVPSSSPEHVSSLNGVSFVKARVGWAVGDTGLKYYPRALIEAWDGTRFSVADAPLPNGLSTFSAVDTDAADDAWAVGYAPGEYNKTLVEHWDGSAWTVG